MNSPAPSKNGESRAATAAANRVASTAEDLQDDLASVQEDILKLSSQIGDLAAAKGAQAWKLARKKIDGVLKEANAKGQEAADAVTDARDNVLAALDEQIETRPYVTLGVALAAGFVIGAMWKR